MLQNQKYKIEKAEKTESAAHHYSVLAEIAADGLFGFLYGSKSSSLLKHLFLKQNTIPNYQNTYFMKIHETVVGKITCYSYECYLRNNESTEKKISKFLGWRIVRLLFALLILKLLRIKLEGVGPKEFYIESIAIYEEFRGNGLSKLLLEYAKILAIEQGCHKISLDVDMKNTIAIAAYKKAGFEILERTKNRKIVKMVLTIS